jgi:DNA-binding beta-propeller fold protein YncE
LNPLDRRILETYLVGDGPSGVTYAAGYVWVINYGGRNISKIDPREGTVVGTLTAGGKPSALASDGQNIWAPVSNKDSVKRVERVKRSVTAKPPSH